MIVMDLEWNRSYDRKEVDEILQIGAVRIDRPGGAILDQFSVFIRPRIHKKFDPGAKKLPDLQASVTSDVEFPAAWKAFNRWRGGERTFAFWGMDDFKALRQNCAFWKIPFEEPELTYNIQRAFAHAYGADGLQMALWRVVDFLNIPECFVFHNALNDAMYTALVTAWLRQEDLDFRPEPGAGRSRRKKTRFSPFDFEAPEEREAGPYAGEAEAMDGRDSRVHPCPVCGQTAWVSRWYGVGESRRCGVFACPRHGNFLCLLTLCRNQDGTVSARAAVPELTPELRSLYNTAKDGDAHICRKSGRADPRRARKRRRRGGRKRRRAKKS